jgi:hypothetical protein|tara:strand:+ start:6204 stop:6824 length:621 start_codon:yes stop_codon:yes gene_type:complete
MKKKKLTKITELIISDENAELSIDCISLVSQPAIEVDFVYMDKQKKNLTMSKIDKYSQEIISPALIPDKNIFRYDPNTDEEFYVYFSKSTVKKASEMYLRYNNHHKATYQHEERIGGILTTESWIIEDPENDKSNIYGYKLKKGTWMVKMKIENPEIWDKILEGELKGVSIEGFFVDRLQEMSTQQDVTDAEILEALNEIINTQKK